MCIEIWIPLLLLLFHSHSFFLSFFHFLGWRREGGRREGRKALPWMDAVPVVGCGRGGAPPTDGWMDGWMDDAPPPDRVTTPTTGRCRAPTLSRSRSRSLSLSLLIGRPVLSPPQRRLRHVQRMNATPPPPDRPTDRPTNCYDTRLFFCSCIPILGRRPAAGGRRQAAGGRPRHKGRGKPSRAKASHIRTKKERKIREWIRFRGRFGGTP